MPIPILYFHGFASWPNSRKVVALKELLEPEFEINAPDMNVPSFEELDWEAIVGRGVEEGRRVPPRVIVGSSLGALIALECVRRGVLAPLVLMAPAIGIGERWLTQLPAGDPIRVFNHARNADAEVRRAFFEQLAAADADKEPPPVTVQVIMGRVDETIPFHVVEAAWKRWSDSGRLQPGSRVHEIPEGDHSLVTYVGYIADTIRRVVRETC